jgi:hypothetical protein
MTAIIGAYMMYNLLDVDVMEAFNIQADKALYFSCIAASQDQAKAAQYADFASAVSSCPLIQDYIFKIRELEFSVLTEYDRRRTKELEKKMGRVVGRDMSKLRGVALAANAKTIRGLAHMMAVLDEMAHMQQEGASYMTAKQVYDALSPSLLQFGRHSLCMMNSSHYTKVGTFYEKYLEALKVSDGKPANNMIFTLQYPSWAGYEGYRDVAKPVYRKVEMASPDWDEDEVDENGEPVYSEEDKEAIKLARNEEASDPQKFKVENRSQWAEVLDAFLEPELVDRAFLGRPTGENQYQAFNCNWANPLPGVDYYCHLDPSSTTAGFGFCMGHTETFPEKNIKTGEIEYHDHHVVVDIVKRWLPKNFMTQGYGTDLVFDYEWVLEEIAHWVAIFRPVEITVDQFGAPTIIAWFSRWCKENEMIGTRIYEKTATARLNWQVAQRFKDALYLDRIHLPNDTPDCDWLALEMKNLQQINSQGTYSKIACPTVGPVQTMDVYSAVSQCCYSLIGDTTVRDTRAMISAVKPAMGAQGGYPLGGSKLQRRSLESLMPGRSDMPGSGMGANKNIDSVNRGNWTRKRYR